MTNRHPLTVQPLLLDDTNLSHAWARAMLHAIDHAGTDIAPLVISVTGFDDNGEAREDDALRAELDKLLLAKGLLNVEDVAFTIFPQSIWKMSKGDRNKLFKYYGFAYPRYRAMDKKRNGRGLYFERLISFGSGPCNGNQLEWILSQYAGRKGVRRSMFQASIFDPARDHDAIAQIPFPCLQHVSFEPTPEGLVINAFYATQQLFVKAYGNYLGIARLGAFMAREMDEKLARMNVFIGVAKFEKIQKTAPELRPLIALARKNLQKNNSKE